MDRSMLLVHSYNRTPFHGMLFSRFSSGGANIVWLLNLVRGGCGSWVVVICGWRCRGEDSSVMNEPNGEGKRSSSLMVY